MGNRQTGDFVGMSDEGEKVTVGEKKDKKRIWLPMKFFYSQKLAARIRKSSLFKRQKQDNCKMQLDEKKISEFRFFSTAPPSNLIYPLTHLTSKKALDKHGSDSLPDIPLPKASRVRSALPILS